MAAPPTFRSIPTKYGGYLFRSRLEARWAVFLDALDVPYVFEPEGYEIEEPGDGFGATVVTRYLPDFWLPTLDTFLEIKPVPPTDEEQHKAALLAAATEKRTIILWGPPTIPGADAFTGSIDPVWGGMLVGPLGWDIDYWWCECTRDGGFTDWVMKRHCGAVGIEYEGRAARLHCPHHESGGRWHSTDTPRLRAAVQAGLSHRFGIW